MFHPECGIAQDQHTVKRKLKIGKPPAPSIPVHSLRRRTVVDRLIVDQPQQVLRCGIFDTVDPAADFQTGERDASRLASERIFQFQRFKLPRGSGKLAGSPCKTLFDLLVLDCKQNRKRRAVTLAHITVKLFEQTLLHTVRIGDPVASRSLQSSMTAGPESGAVHLFRLKINGIHFQFCFQEKAERTCKVILKPGNGNCRLRTGTAVVRLKHEPGSRIVPGRRIRHAYRIIQKSGTLQHIAAFPLKEKPGKFLRFVFRIEPGSEETDGSARTRVQNGFQIKQIARRPPGVIRQTEKTPLGIGQKRAAAHILRNHAVVHSAKHNFAGFAPWKFQKTADTEIMFSALTVQTPGTEQLQKIAKALGERHVPVKRTAPYLKQNRFQLRDFAPERNPVRRRKRMVGINHREPLPDHFRKRLSPVILP